MMTTRIAATVLVAAVPAVALAGELSFKGRPPVAVRANQTPAPATPVKSKPPARAGIPVGTFGLVLDDGTRVIGVPSKRWAAALQTRLGRVTVPHDQISGIESGADEVHVHLRNGDYISGRFVPNTILFATRFGELRFPAEAIVRLRRRFAPEGHEPAATIASLIPRLTGDWVVTYTNRTRQSRTIKENRIVNGRDRLVEKNGDLLILFPTVIERITLVDDKLFVEHFNPRSTYPDGIPAVMGVGRRTTGR
jgi:hypothetical protein